MKGCIIMSLIRNIVYRLIFKYRATPQTFERYLKKRCKQFGKNVYLANPHKITIDNDALSFIQIGDNVQILSGVTILAHDESYTVCGDVYNFYPRVQKDTIIGNNVFIGLNSTILMGTRIGDNTIIGANSTVSGNIEPNSVYAGNPARKIMSLDDYFESHMKQFINSAVLYFERFYERHKRYPKADEMHVYKLLIENEIVKADVNKPSEVVSKVNNSNYFKKYKSIEEFLMNNYQND